MNNQLSIFPGFIKSKIVKPKREILTKDFHVKEASNGKDLIVEGFANPATVDRAKEILTKDNWELDNYKKNPMMLFNHDRMIMIGKGTQYVPEDEGLFFAGTISKSTNAPIPYIRDMIEEKILNQFSVGFDDHGTAFQEKDVTRFKRAELIEVSAVSLPMNQDAGFEVQAKQLYLAKDYRELASRVVRQKGHMVASMLHDVMNMAALRVDGFDMKEAVARIKDLSSLGDDEIRLVLAGEVTPIPDSFIKAFSQVFVVPTSWMISDANYEAAEYGDRGLTNPLPTSSEDQESEGEKSKDADNEKGKSEDDKKSEDEEDEDKKGEGEGEGEGEDGESKKSDNSSSDSSDDGSDDSDPDSMKNFQDCVSKKIPKFIEDGKDPSDAIAAAFDACSEDKGEKCLPGARVVLKSIETCIRKGESPDDAIVLAIEESPELEPMLDKLIQFADDISTKAQKAEGEEDGEAESEASNDEPPVETEDSPDTSTEPEGTPIAKSDATDFGSPFLDNAKAQLSQLGALNTQVKSMSEAFAEGTQSIMVKLTEATEMLKAASETLAGLSQKNVEENEQEEEENQKFLEEVSDTLDRFNDEILTIKKSIN